MARTKKPIGFWGVLFHTVMTILTGGLWLVGVVIYFLINRAR